MRRYYLQLAIDQSPKLTAQEPINEVLKLTNLYNKALNEFYLKTGKTMIEWINIDFVMCRDLYDETSGRDDLRHYKSK